MKSKVIPITDQDRQFAASLKAAGLLGENETPGIFAIGVFANSRPQIAGENLSIIGCSAMFSNYPLVDDNIGWEKMQSRADECDMDDTRITCFSHQDLSELPQDGAMIIFGKLNSFPKDHGHVLELNITRYVMLNNEEAGYLPAWLGTQTIAGGRNMDFLSLYKSAEKLAVTEEALAE